MRLPTGYLAVWPGMVELTAVPVPEGNKRDMKRLVRGDKSLLLPSTRTVDDRLAEVQISVARLVSVQAR